MKALSLFLDCLELATGEFVRGLAEMTLGAVLLLAKFAINEFNVFGNVLRLITLLKHLRDIAVLKSHPIRTGNNTKAHIDKKRFITKTLLLLKNAPV